MKNRLSTILTVILFALSLLLCLGVKFLFHACGPADDGTYMSCHWAQNAVMTAGGAAAVIFAGALILKERKTRAGAVFAGIPVTIAAMLLASNNIIRLCAMKDMRCWAVMRLSVLIIGVIMLIIEIIDLIAATGEAKSYGIS